MWQIQAQLALDLARERADEARRQRLADRAREATALETRIHALPQSPGRARTVTAATLRAASGLFGSISDAACEAATRLDHRTA